MSRILIPLFVFILCLSVSAQMRTQIAATSCQAFQTTVGRTYFVSAAPDSGADAVLGVGFGPNLPMAVINNQGLGLSETYTVQASANTVQVCVYLNRKEANHTLVVLDDEQKFPFLMSKGASTVALETDDEGYITSFKFAWRRGIEIASKASAVRYENQGIAANSGISYTFKTSSGVPLDFLLVPETNHLDLAVHSDLGNGYEVVDYDRAAADISETGKGQVEWFQAYPVKNEITVVVENKSSFGGLFKIAVRNLNKTGPPIVASAWRFLNAFELRQFIEASRTSLPLITETQAVTYELSASRLIEEYSFTAYAFEPGLEFALIIRTDPNKPPLFVQAGGESSRSALFYWKVIAGEVSIPGTNRVSEEKVSGFPGPGKILISIVSYGGSGRVGVSYKEADGLVPLELPERKTSARAEIIALFSASYDGYELIQSDFDLYRYEAVDGETYNLKVTPGSYFDVLILDPSGRTEEKPTSLELVDENGRGVSEYLKVTAHGGILEFGVAGTRYFQGRVNKDNKRLGGTGYYNYEVTDSAGNTPKFREKIDVSLPNEFVSKEIDLIFQPWDGFPVNAASSDNPPFPVVYDKRILDAFVQKKD